MIKPYDRESAVEYARKWALKRNPQYYNFDGLGGDCTNFVSQCVYAGSKVMNYSPVGWYYNDVTDRAPAWTGVEFFYNFITENNSNGPFGVIVNPFEAQVGDVITLSKSSGDQFHTLFISNIINGSFFVSSHTRDGLDIPLEVFSFYQARFIHIQGVRDI